MGPDCDAHRRSPSGRRPARECHLRPVAEPVLTVVQIQSPYRDACTEGVVGGGRGLSTAMAARPLDWPLVTIRSHMSLRLIVSACRNSLARLHFVYKISVIARREPVDCGPDGYTTRFRHRNEGFSSSLADPDKPETDTVMPPLDRCESKNVAL